MLTSLYANGTESITFSQLLICMAVSLGLGLLVAASHMYRNTYTKSFVVTLAILPVLVQSVIMLVNGNLGTGMAVVGAFSLIRFRSVPGGPGDYQYLLVHGHWLGYRDGLCRLYFGFFTDCGCLFTVLVQHQIRRTAESSGAGIKSYHSRRFGLSSFIR